MNALGRWGPIALFLCGTAALAGIGLRDTEGSFIYPVDDAYIHLAMARTLSEQGTYGLEMGTFSPASSSILWPFLLAFFRRVGLVSSLVPLAINVCAGTLLLRRLLRPLDTFPARWRWGVAACIFFLLPLHALVLVGMEHALHALFCVLLVRAASEALGTTHTPVDGRGPGESTGAASRANSVAIFAFLAALIRYETLFVSAAVVLLAVVRGRPRVGLAALAAFLPLAAFGAWIHGRTGLWVPLPIQLKREHLEVATFFPSLLKKIWENSHIVSMLTLLAAALAVRPSASATERLQTRATFGTREAALLLAILVLGFQIAFAQIGWFYRYEAYALVLAFYALLQAAPDLGDSFSPPRGRILFAVGLAALPLITRGLSSLRTVPLASRNIFEQQVQIARFVRSLGERRAVAVNDIGAVAYFAEVPVLDLMGISNLEVARAKEGRIERPMSALEIDRLVHASGAELAVVYPEWFAGAIPEAWTPLGSWKIHDNRVCAKDLVTFFATTNDAKLRLLPRWKAFSKALPKGVEVIGP